MWELTNQINHNVQRRIASDAYYLDKVRERQKIIIGYGDRATDNCNKLHSRQRDDSNTKKNGIENAS
jgi:hypothetical protein